MKNNNSSKLSSGIVILITILIIAVLGLGGYIIYEKVIDKNDNTTNTNDTNNNVENNNTTTDELNGLKSITYTVCEDKPKTINDTEKMKKIVNIINTKVAIEQEGLGGTCTVNLTLNYATSIITVRIVGDNLVIIDNQVYKITSPNSTDPSIYISSLFK